MDQDEAMKIWKSLLPMMKSLIKEECRGFVNRRKMQVTTAYSSSTGTIGVTESFGQEIFIPASSAAQSVPVGNSVWVESWYGKNNMIAMYPGNMQ